MRATISAVFIAAALFGSGAAAQDAPKFAIDATWPKDLPKDWITGQLGGVCMGAQDHVYVVNRRNITDEEKETSVVHWIAMSNAGLIYACDRQGNRVQVFQEDGTFVRNILIPNASGKLPTNGAPRGGSRSRPIASGNSCT